MRYNTLIITGALFGALWHTTFFSALQERERQGPYLSVSNVQRCAEESDCFVKHQPGMAGLGWAR